MGKLNHYNMSFTAGGLFVREGAELARLFQILGDWKAVKKKVLDENRIQARTASSSIRICREICLRLAELNDTELQILADGSLPEQQQILWVAICRHHRFIYDFAIGIIREKYLQLDYDLRLEDYDAFFNAKAATHDELEDLTESTRGKLRQVVFRMLRETGLLTKEDVIIPTSLTPWVARVIGSGSPDDLRIFLLSDSDIKELLK